MTREIKFRGKNLDNEEWVCGFYRQYPIYKSCGTCVDHINHFIDHDCESEFVHPDTVSQYTGLKDKNGKEIYEDEILTDCHGSIGAVEWDNGRFVVNFGGGDVFEIGECFNESYEVWSIGNIHDNPELLKGGAE